MHVRKFAKAVLPIVAYNAVKKFQIRHLCDEINNLQIKSISSNTENVPWVELQNGRVFFGLPPNERELYLKSLICDRIPKYPTNAFGTILEIISRYKAPRSLPGELTHNTSRWELIRDPLEDFELKSAQKQAIAEIFQPKPGANIIDIGAFHGFGTMRLAEYIGETGTIVAVEANPVSLEILNKNIYENGFNNIIVVPKAVSYQKAREIYIITAYRMEIHSGEMF